LRNHRKIAVVDGAVGFVGSQNIVEPDYGHKRIGEWHDIMARLTGPVIGHLQRIILEDWFYETGETLDDDVYFPAAQPTGAAAGQVVPTGPDQPHGLYQDLVVLAIHSARKHITITTPYFVPDEPAFLALRSALLRDVCVDLVIPERTDRRLVDAAASYYWDDLLKRGSNVYQHSDGLLHAKTLSVDGTLGMFGSANFDIRSFHLNFELSLLTYDANVTAQLKKLQDEYLKQSKKLDQAHWERRPLRSRAASGVAKVLSSIL
jgi:cardiolipin synthase